MRPQAANLNEAAKQVDRRITSLAISSTCAQDREDAKLMPNRCPGNSRLGDPANGPAWNGWGVDTSNTRFQTEKAAGLTAARKCRSSSWKWAFGLPGASSVFGQPAIAGGRVFLGVDTGFVDSLDAGTGCVHWSFEAEAGVRTAITVFRIAKTRAAIFFGDMRSQRLRSGCRNRRNDLEGPRWRNILPLASPERRSFSMAACMYRSPPPRREQESNPKYPCCTFRR